MEDVKEAHRTYPRSSLKKLTSETGNTMSSRRVTFIDDKTGDRRTLATVFEVDNFKECNFAHVSPMNRNVGCTCSIF